MSVCELCEEEFEGEGTKCADCAPIEQEVKPEEPKEEVKAEKSKAKAKKPTAAQLTKEVADLKAQIAIIEATPVVEPTVTAKGFIEWLVESGEKWVISHRHNMPRIYQALKDYEAITK